VNFAYIPRNDLRVHADASSGNRRERSPDFSEFATKAAAGGSHAEEDEHVLVLDFNSSSKGKKASGYITTSISHTRSRLTVHSSQILVRAPAVAHSGRDDQTGGEAE
jgi:hypothetical protein